MMFSDGAWAFLGVVVTGIVTLAVARLNRPRNQRRVEALAVGAAEGAVGHLDRRIAAAEERTSRAEARADRAAARAEVADTKVDELRARAQAAEERADAADRMARECEEARRRNEAQIGTLHLVVAEQGLRLAVLIEAVQRQLPDLDVASLLAAYRDDPDRPHGRPHTEGD